MGHLPNMKNIFKAVGGVLILILVQSNLATACERSEELNSTQEKWGTLSGVLSGRLCSKSLMTIRTNSNRLYRRVFTADYSPGQDPNSSFYILDYPNFDVTGAHLYRATLFFFSSDGMVALNECTSWSTGLPVREYRVLNQYGSGHFSQVPGFLPIISFDELKSGDRDILVIVQDPHQTQELGSARCW